jgi:hypothetical protein
VLRLAIALTVIPLALSAAGPGDDDGPVGGR